MKALLCVVVLACIATSFAALPTSSAPTASFPTFSFPTLPPSNGGTHVDIPSSCSTAWCDLSSIFGGSVPGSTEDVTLKTNTTGEFRVLISSDLSVKSLSIMSTYGGTASVRVAAGTLLKIANGLNVTTGAALEVLGSLWTTGSVSVSGTLNISASASAAFLGGLNLTAGASLICSSSYVILANATHSIDGSISASGNAVINITHSRTNLTGSINVDASSSFYVSSGQLDVAASAFITGTLTLSGAASLIGYGGAALLDSVNVTGAGNIFGSADVDGSIGVAAGLSVSADGELTIAARAEINSTLSVSGKLSVNANVTCNAGASIDGYVEASGLFTLLSIGHASTNVSGNISISAGGVVEFRNATCRISGLLVSDNISRVFLNGSIVTFTPEAIVNCTVELNRTYVNSTDSVCSFQKVIVSGPNSTIEAPVDKYTEFNDTLFVAVNASLNLIGHVIARANVSINGSFSASASASWTGSGSAYLQFAAGLNVDANANFSLQASAYALVQAGGALNGTVQLYDNTTFHAQDCVASIGSLIVFGANATVKASVGGLIQLLNNITVAAGAALNFTGNATIAGITTAWGGIHIGVEGSISASDYTFVNFTSQFAVAGAFILNAQAEAQFWAGAWINGTAALAKNSTFKICSGTATFAWNVTAAGTTVVNGTLSCGGGAAAWNQTDGSLIIGNGVVWASKVYIGGNASADVNAAAALKGAGTINGDVEVSGNAAIGFSPGVMNVNGDYVLDSSSNTDLEIASATSFDTIVVSGNVVRAGTLTISLLDGYVPASASSFAFLQFASGTGSFNVVQASTGKFVELDAATSSSVTFTASPNGPTTVPTSSPNTPTSAPVPASAAVVKGEMLIVAVIMMIVAAVL